MDSLPFFARLFCWKMGAGVLAEKEKGLRKPQAFFYFLGLKLLLEATDGVGKCFTGWGPLGAGSAQTQGQKQRQDSSGLKALRMTRKHCYVILSVYCRPLGTYFIMYLFKQPTLFWRQNREIKTYYTSITLIKI